MADGKKTKLTLANLIPYANQEHDAIYLITHEYTQFNFQLGNGREERIEFSKIQSEFNSMTQNSPAKIKRVLACYYCVPYEIRVKLSAKTEIKMDSQKCAESVNITPISATIHPSLHTLPSVELYP